MIKGWKSNSKWSSIAGRTMANKMSKSLSQGPVNMVGFMAKGN